MEELLEKVKTYDWGQSRLPLTEVSDRIRAAYGNAEELKKIEKSLLGVLASDATYAAKQYVCRELSIIGTEQSVPMLSKMLTDEKLSDMARYALERIHGPQVNEALREAMDKTEGKAGRRPAPDQARLRRVGIINSLGQRRCTKAVTALGKLTGSSDGMIAEAAVSALGKIGGDEAAEILAKEKEKAKGNLKMVVLDAYLKCAEQYLDEGSEDKALVIYRELYKKGQPQLIRSAAMRGIVKATQKTKSKR